MDQQDRFQGCLLGLAVGDAVGTTVEFKPRGSFPPVVDMLGKGPFSLHPGEWTDDTSMALCLATSLIEKKGFDAQDQMERYWKWYQTGYLSSNGRCFDIGNTVRQALERYHQTGNPFSASTQPNTAGNGSIMRLAPIPMYFFPNQDEILHFSGESSRTTHGAAECVDACRLLGDILYRALKGSEKEEILLETTPSLLQSQKVKEIAKGGYFQKDISEIRGSGYVIESLEAALWCFWTTASYKEAILKAANLGEDADTTAAICGQVAGAYYGKTSIPAPWLNRLVMREAMEQLAEQLFP